MADERPGVNFLLELPVDLKDTCVDDGTYGYAGITQSPINLDTTMEIYEYFEDSYFKYNYETIDPRYSYKFNQ